MAEITSKTRLLPPMFDTRRVSSPTASSPTRRHRRNQSLQDDYDIAPSAILDAFVDNILPNPENEEYKYLVCSQGATSVEKGLVIKAANIAANSRDWCHELKAWKWRGTFNTPEEAERETISMRNIDGGINTIPLEYWGCLPAAVVEAYETRVDEINNEMADMDIEQLKGYVLDIHETRSRPSSSYEQKKTQLNLMDDISLLVTGTMVQALPFLGQLDQLLDAWSIRLTTLRAAPAFLRDLSEVKVALELAWDAIAMPEPDKTTDEAVAAWKEAVRTITEVLQEKIGSLGQRLDGMLDSLEGRNDCIPDNWIDDFETLEAKLGDWLGEARKRRIRLDIRWSSNPLREQPVNLDAFPAVPKKSHARNLSMVQEEPVSNQDVTTSPRPKTSSGAQQTPKGRAVSPDRIGLGRAFTPERRHSGAPRSPFHSPMHAALERATASPEPDTVAAAYERSPPGSRPRSVTYDDWKRGGFVFPDLHNTEADELEFEEDEDEGVFSRAEPRPSIVKRASMTSIESFTKGAVRAVNVKRPGSINSQSSLQRPKSAILPDTASSHSDFRHDARSPRPSRQSSLSHGRSVDLIGDEAAVVVAAQRAYAAAQTPEPKRRASIGSPLLTTPPNEIDSPVDVDSPSFRANRTNPLPPNPPLNAAMKKTRHPDLVDSVIASDDQGNAALQPNANAQNTQTTSPKKPRHGRTLSGSTDTTDELDRQISDILTTVPAKIRLTSAAEAEGNTKSPRSFSNTLGSILPRPSSVFRSSRSSTKTPELLLSPVKNNEGPSLKKQSDHGDIKLYHLIQPGREKPIKLFIRRVGENGERVMVRVGGGWADLGEYLRQYAEHHGRRIVSGGNLEVLDPETVNTRMSQSPSGTPTKSSYPIASPALTSSGRNSPFPTAAVAANAAAVGTPTTAGATQPNFSTPNSGAVHAARLAATNTPGTASSVGSNTSWRGEEVGLAGPAAKRLDLSEDKLEWIDNMMSQARRVSGGQSNGRDLGRDSSGGASKDSVKDLGKVGATRRVFLKSGRDRERESTGERSERGE